MESKRVVSRARAEHFATEVGGILCETSAKENWGVNELFARVRGKASLHVLVTACTSSGLLGASWSIFIYYFVYTSYKCSGPALGPVHVSMKSTKPRTKSSPVLSSWQRAPTLKPLLITWYTAIAQVQEYRTGMIEECGAPLPSRGCKESSECGSG